MRMFQAVDLSGLGHQWELIAQEHIDWARRVLKKSDAIVWYLRWSRIHMYWESLRRKTMHEKGLRSLDTLEPDKVLNKLLQKTGKSEGIRRWQDIAKYMASGPQARRNLEHFLSLDIAAINDYEFGNKNPQEIIRNFRKIEEEWKEKYDGLIPMEDNDQIIMDFENGYSWLFLDRSECDLESKAMGHCGNAAGTETDRILSLRSRVEGPEGKPVWKVWLTFILHSNDHLGEMKGRGNDKPREEFHPYIVALLGDEDLSAIIEKKTVSDKDVFTRKDERGEKYYTYVDDNEVEVSPWDPRGDGTYYPNESWEDKHGEIRYSQYHYTTRTPTDITIKGIRGGGYLPENNFKLSDLDQEAQDALVEKKPSLGTIEYQYRKFGMTSDLKKQVYDLVEAKGYIEGKGFVIGDYDDDINKAIENLGTIAIHQDNNGSFPAAIWAADIVSGNSFVEIYDAPDDSELESIYNQANPDIQERIQERLQSLMKTEVSYHDVFSFLEEHDTLIYDALKQAYTDGAEVGTQNEIYEDLVSWLKEHSIVYENGWKFIVSDEEAVEGAMEIQSSGDEYETDMSFVEWYASYIDGEITDLQGPHYGWHGFDDEAATNRFEELLYEEGIL